MTQEIVIVGGGIIGMTIAHRLADGGEGHVTVVDRDLAGLGASARSAGLHFPVGRSTRVREMTRFSQAHYQARMGAIARMRPLPMRVHMCGGAADRIGPWFIPEAALTRRGNTGGLVIADHGLTSWDAQGAHHADVGAYVTHLAETAPPQIARVEGSPVVAISETDSAVDVQLADGRLLRADRLILAPGPWFGAAAFQPLTRNLGLRVKRIVAFHIDMPPQETDAAEYFIEDDAFLLPLVWARRWLFSYTCDEWDMVPETAGPGVQAHHRTAAADILRRYIPDWAERLTGGRVFCDAYSADRIPVIRTVGNSGRIVFAGGANGAGYRLAPAIAEAVAEQISHSMTKEHVA
ncbi:MAG: NAD(P)/FAD-dependent oxidoreductase [Paracoccaceae bacterium]